MTFSSTTKTARCVKRSGTRRKDPVARMNNALLAEYNGIKGLIVQAERQDVQARYQIAVRCDRVREGDGQGGKYGAGAVANLAKALGVARSYVYEYANVAKTWPDKKEFDDVIASTDRFGKLLTWSHIVLFATVATAEHRSKLIADSLQHGWNVRELRKKLRTGMSDDNGQIPTAIPQPTIPRVLAATVEDYVTQVAALKSNAATFGVQLVERINQTDPADITPALVSRLTEAREDLSDLLKQIDKCIEQIQKARSVTLRPQDDWGCAAADQPQDRSCHDHQEQPREALVGAS